MFLAIRNGKVRDNLASFHPGEQWRDFYKSTEDFLTAAVFGRLSYLPSADLWRLIGQAGGQVPCNAGMLKSREFWPHWDIRSVVGGRSFVEPDVFFDFEHLYLIVEAKADDQTTAQSHHQWACEVVGLLSQPEFEVGKPICLLAIGGNGERLSQQHVTRMEHDAEALLRRDYGQSGHPFSVIGMPWRALLDGVVEMLREQGTEERALLLNDVVDILDFHGVRKKAFLETLSGQPAGVSAGDFDRASSALTTGFGRQIRPICPSSDDWHERGRMYLNVDYPLGAIRGIGRHG